MTYFRFVFREGEHTKLEVCNLVGPTPLTVIQEMMKRLYTKKVSKFKLLEVPHISA